MKSNISHKTQVTLWSEQDWVVVTANMHKILTKFGFLRYESGQTCKQTNGHPALLFFTSGRGKVYDESRKAIWVAKEWLIHTHTTILRLSGLCLGPCELVAEETFAHSHLSSLVNIEVSSTGNNLLPILLKYWLSYHQYFWKQLLIRYRRYFWAIHITISIHFDGRPRWRGDQKHWTRPALA